MHVQPNHHATLSEELMNHKISTIGLVAVFAIGCASTVQPGRLAATETAVQSARAAGAERITDANTHLKLAEDELAQAKRLNSQGDGHAAEALLSRAESDAALAAALSDEAREKEPPKVPTDSARAKQQPEPSR
jgi:hypothetical protein